MQLHALTEERACNADVQPVRNNDVRSADCVQKIPRNEVVFYTVNEF